MTPMFLKNARNLESETCSHAADDVLAEAVFACRSPALSVAANEKAVSATFSFSSTGRRPQMVEETTGTAAGLAML